MGLMEAAHRTPKDGPFQWHKQGWLDHVTFQMSEFSIKMLQVSESNNLNFLTVFCVATFNIICLSEIWLNGQGYDNILFPSTLFLQLEVTWEYIE
jgi:hypothetical protein